MVLTSGSYYGKWKPFYELSSVSIILKSKPIKNQRSGWGAGREWGDAPSVTVRKTITGKFAGRRGASSL